MTTCVARTQDANQAPDRLRSIVADCRPQLILVRKQDRQALEAAVLGERGSGASVGDNGEAEPLALQPRASQPMRIVEVEPVFADKGIAYGGEQEGAPKSASGDPTCFPRADGEALSHVYYTSGSTGTPKVCSTATGRCHEGLIGYQGKGFCHHLCMT